MVAKKKKPMEHYTVVGLQYRTTKEARRHLATKVPFSVIFKREKKNEHDPNAIAVFVAQGNFLAGHHIGYLRREVAAVISPKVDAEEMSLPAFGIIDAMNVDHGTAEVKMALQAGKLKA